MKDQTNLQVPAYVHQEETKNFLYPPIDNYLFLLELATSRLENCE